MKTVRIGEFTIGSGHRVFVAAEIGGNFTTYQEAVRLIDSAKDCGVNAVKLQTYKADTLVSRRAIFEMENTGRVFQHELFTKYEIDEALHRRIFDYARASGILLFSTPSHSTDLDLLESLNVPAYKIGSDDACNLPFLRQVAQKKKPVILSTGMCTMDEVSESVSTILETGNEDLILLHCVAAYPAYPEHVNLRAMRTMAREFELPVGYSDHTIGTEVCLAAVAMGANVIEKHFTVDKNASGPDHLLSADSQELAELVTGIRKIESALGDGIKQPAQSEIQNRKNNRKSIVAVRPIAVGETITRDMLDVKRPGMGIPPKYVEVIVGKKVCIDIHADEIVTWEMIL